MADYTKGSRWLFSVLRMAVEQDIRFALGLGDIGDIHPRIRRRVSMYIDDGILYPLNWICSIELPSPSVMTFTETVPDRPGEYFFSSEYEARFITLTLTSQQQDKHLARRALYAQFDPLLGEQELRYENITYLVKPYQMIELTDYPFNLQAIVPLRLSEPFGYGPSKEFKGNGVVVNEGNWYAYPSFEIPESAGPSATISVGGLTLEIGCSFSEPLVVDCQWRTAFIGSANAIKYVAGQWPTIQPGSNTVVGPAVLVTRWRDRYI